MRYSSAMEEFVSWCVLAHDCGWTEEDVVLKLTEACDKSQSLIPASHVTSCTEDVCIVWLTLDQIKRPGARWSTRPCVSAATRRRWLGFVRLIVDAYFDHRMAAYPLDRLQIELALTAGRMASPHAVAEWSRFVFETLHHVVPQFPRD